MRAVSAALMAVFWGFYTSSAMAVCDNPIPELLWMSPAKNAVDVPVNAALIVGVAPGVPVAAFLDDTPLNRLDSGAFGPLNLVENTTYSVLLELGEGPTIKKITAQFTTGSQTAADATDAPVVAASARAISDSCNYMAKGYGCLDSGQALELLDVRTSGLGFHVTAGDQTSFWPAECSPQFPSNKSTCYSVASLSHSGAVSTAINHCVAGASKGSDGGGCSIGKAGSGRASILPLACALFGFMAFMKRLYGQDD